MGKSLYILDGHYQMYRAFYAPFRDLSSPAGEPTRATYVFCQTLFALLRDRRPDYLAMVLDADDEKSFRRELDPAYKANREPMPEPMHVQIERIVSIVQTLGTPVYVIEGFEADDLMATMSEKLKDQTVDVYLVSRDKDLEQLIGERVFLYDAANQEVIDAKALRAKKGYTPQQAVEIQTLAGDSTDNVPGVPGVGIKTAARLIGQYGTAASVIAHAAELTPKMAERLRAFAPQLERTRQLVTLRRDAALNFSLADCATDRLRFEALAPVFEELGFNRLRDQLDVLASGSAHTRPRNLQIAVPEAASAAPAAPAPRRAQRGNYRLVVTTEALRNVVEALAARSIFAFDTETTGLNPVNAELVGVSLCWQSGEAYYLPVRGLGGHVLPLSELVEGLRPAMENPAVRKVGQNLKYDLLVLRQAGINVAGAWFDTMIASFLLDPLARSHSINALARSYFDHDMIPITDLIGKGRSQITLDQVDLDRVCEYAGEDADFTWRLYEVLEPRIRGSHLEPLFVDTEMPLVAVLAEMEHHGIALDTALLRRLSQEFADRTAELKREIHRAAGHSFNVDSTRQLATVLFDEQGLHAVRLTKTGRSTDAATLQTLAGLTENPVPRLVLEYRELAKLKSTYVDTLPKMICRRTGRVHASFDQTGAVTGRLSSSDPNLQNIPVRTETGRQIRAAIVAGDDDHVLLTADYSQIELRLLAHFSQDEALMEAFRAGQDIHRSVAAQVHGIGLEDVSPAQRSAAKAVNFGIIYGQSAFGLARSLGIPVGEARTFIDAYFKRYPGIRAFIDRCIENARQLGYAETILGRRRPTPELQSRNRQQRSFGERIAVNTVVQGSAADLIKRAMIEIHRAQLAGLHKARMLIQVHDELVFEVHRHEVDAAAAVIRDRMENAIGLSVPIVADIAWGQNWVKTKP